MVPLFECIDVTVYIVFTVALQIPNMNNKACYKYGLFIN